MAAQSYSKAAELQARKQRDMTGVPGARAHPVARVASRRLARCRFIGCGRCRLGRGQRGRAGRSAGCWGEVQGLAESGPLEGGRVGRERDVGCGHVHEVGEGDLGLGVAHDAGTGPSFWRGLASRRFVLPRSSSRRTQIPRLCVTSWVVFASASICSGSSRRSTPRSSMRVIAVVNSLCCQNRLMFVSAGSPSIRYRNWAGESLSTSARASKKMMNLWVWGRRRAIWPKTRQRYVYPSPAVSLCTPITPWRSNHGDPVWNTCPAPISDSAWGARQVSGLLRCFSASCAE